MTLEANLLPVDCPKCEQRMRSAMVQTAIWHNERLFVVEDVPAYACDLCMEQFYDEEITDALRRLTEDGFPAVEAKREILVPVFSLSGRLPPKRPVVEGLQIMP